MYTYMKGDEKAFVTLTAEALAIQKSISSIIPVKRRNQSI